MGEKRGFLLCRIPSETPADRTTDEAGEPPGFS
jgi:hypothetical protein